MLWMHVRLRGYLPLVQFGIPRLKSLSVGCYFFILNVMLVQEIDTHARSYQFVLSIVCVRLIIML